MGNFFGSEQESNTSTLSKIMQEGSKTEQESNTSTLSKIMQEGSETDAIKYLESNPSREYDEMIPLQWNL